MGAELFHADGQTDMPELIVAFRDFANVPKNYTIRKGSLLDYVNAVMSYIELR